MRAVAEVKTETGKVATVMEREAISMLHHCMSNDRYLCWLEVVKFFFSATFRLRRSIAARKKKEIEVLQAGELL